MKMGKNERINETFYCFWPFYQSRLTRVFERGDAQTSRWSSVTLPLQHRHSCLKKNKGNLKLFKEWTSTTKYTIQNLHWGMRIRDLDSSFVKVARTKPTHQVKLVQTLFNAFFFVANSKLYTTTSHQILLDSGCPSVHLWSYSPNWWHRVVSTVQALGTDGTNSCSQPCLGCKPEADLRSQNTCSKFCL